MRKIWSKINYILSRKTNNKSIPDHFIDGNKIITDKQTIANNFNSYFINIGPNMACNITNTNDSDFSHYLKEKIDIIVHFKRLGSRCFYDLFERYYFFFLNRYAYSKTKPLDILG